MTTSPAPITQSIVDEDGLPTLPWTIFFNQRYEGDSGTSWTPEFVSLTGNLSSLTGTYYQISQHLTLFTINIEPDGNTSTTSGTTYIEGFPLTFNNDGFNTVVSGTAGGAIGMNVASTGRIYPPAWTNVSLPLTIIGIAEAS